MRLPNGAFYCGCKHASRIVPALPFVAHTVWFSRGFGGFEPDLEVKAAGSVTSESAEAETKGGDVCLSAGFV